MQPISLDKGGLARFKRNALVRYLLDAGPFDLHQLRLLPNIPDEDWEQLAQLIGYTVGGFSDLSYVSDEARKEADEKVAALLRGKP